MKTTTKYKVPFPKQINLLPTRPYTKHVGMVPSVHNYHLEMKSSVRISRMEVWRPGVYFQTNANTSSNKHLFLSHAILLLCDIYICIWNKKNVLLCICSLALSRAQGLSVGLQYTLTLNIYLCTNQFGSAWTFVGQRDRDLCVHMCVSTPASQHYFLRDCSNAATAKVAADHNGLQSKCFWCFPKHRTMGKKHMWCVQCLFWLACEWEWWWHMHQLSESFFTERRIGIFLMVCVVLN